MAQFCKSPQVWKMPNESKPICAAVHYLFEAEPYCFENPTRRLSNYILMYLDMQKKTKSGVLHQVTLLVNGQVTFTVMCTKIT